MTDDVPSAGSRKQGYYLRVSEPTDDGDRHVQVFKQVMDPIRTEPVGKPFRLNPDEPMVLDLNVEAEILVGNLNLGVRFDHDVQEVDPNKCR